MRHVRLPVSHCPVCGAMRDGARNEEGVAPQAGDYSVCVGCSAVSIFADDLTLRGLTRAELNELVENDAARHAVERVVVSVRLRFGGRQN